MYIIYLLFYHINIIFIYYLCVCVFACVCVCVCVCECVFVYPFGDQSFCVLFFENEYWALPSIYTFQSYTTNAYAPPTSSSMCPPCPIVNDESTIQCNCFNFYIGVSIWKGLSYALKTVLQFNGDMFALNNAAFNATFAAAFASLEGGNGGNQTEFKNTTKWVTDTFGYCNNTCFTMVWGNDIQISRQLRQFLLQRVRASLLQHRDFRFERFR